LRERDRIGEEKRGDGVGEERGGGKGEGNGGEGREGKGREGKYLYISISTCPGTNVYFLERYSKINQVFCVLF
jgi:hypothetical protein